METEFVDYLARIDWVMAVAAAVVAVSVAALLLRFLAPATDQLVGVGHDIRLWIARRALERRPGLTRTPWACPTCRSINTPTASLCYRGCGPRPVDAAEPSPAPDDLPIQRGGRSPRRG